VNGEFIESVREMSRNSGVPEEQIIEAIKEALLKSYIRVMKSDSVLITVENDELKMYQKKLVVETVRDELEEISLEDARKIKKDAVLDEEVLILMNPEEMGRIAAQISQQTIMSNIKEKEKDILYEKYKEKEGQIIAGLFQRKTRKSDIIVDLGDIEGILPYERQMPKDRVKIGEKVRVYIKSVEKDKNNNVRILLTRTNPEFVQNLFEIEVPEIVNGLIEIKGISRDAGERTKIAVYSDAPDIDPVGACVGMRGARIQTIIRELDGEKIDIVRWDEDIAKFIKNILNPIPVINVKLNPEEKTAMVVVPKDQLSTAIGKGGKNVRLAAILTGWTIDIKSSEDFEKLVQAEESREMLKNLFQDVAADTVAEEETEKETPKEETVNFDEIAEKVRQQRRAEEEEEEEEISIEELPDVPGHILKKLKDNGYETIESIIDLSEKELLKIPGIGKKNAELILKSLEENVKVIEE